MPLAHVVEVRTKDIGTGHANQRQIVSSRTCDFDITPSQYTSAGVCQALLRRLRLGEHRSAERCRALALGRFGLGAERAGERAASHDANAVNSIAPSDTECLEGFGACKLLFEGHGWERA